MSSDPYDIPELVELAKQDPRYFGELIEICQPSLSISVRKLGIDDGTADDVVQETFLRAFTHLQQLRDPKKFREWLHGIARIVMKEMSRETTRRIEAEVVHGRLLEAAQDEETVEEEMTPLQLHEAIDVLSPELREIIRLKHLHQPPLSPEEIADRMGISLSTSYDWLHNAYAQLQRIRRSYDG